MRNMFYYSEFNNGKIGLCPFASLDFLNVSFWKDFFRRVIHSMLADFDSNPGVDYVFLPTSIDFFNFTLFCYFSAEYS